MTEIQSWGDVAVKSLFNFLAKLFRLKIIFWQSGLGTTSCLVNMEKWLIMIPYFLLVDRGSKEIQKHCKLLHVLLIILLFAQN